MSWPGLAGDDEPTIRSTAALHGHMACTERAPLSPLRRDAGSHPRARTDLIRDRTADKTAASLMPNKSIGRVVREKNKANARFLRGADGIATLWIAGRRK